MRSNAISHSFPHTLNYLLTHTDSFTDSLTHLLAYSLIMLPSEYQLDFWVHCKNLLEFVVYLPKI